MATYYYLICDNHREKCDAASRSAGGVGHLCDSSKVLPHFLYTHAGCTLRVISEHQEDEEFSYKEWSKENLDEMNSLERE